MSNEKKVEAFFYKVYGLIVKSDIKLPELIQVRADKEIKVDITISLGNVPEKVLKAKEEGKIVEILKAETWFNINNVACYYISNGNSIIVETYEQAMAQEIKTYLLGSAFGFLLIQKNIVAIHGGTVIVNDMAVILTGDSGAGKSTLTSAFRINGYPFLADDVSVATLDRWEIPFIQPAYPQQKLCRDAMVKLGYDTSNFIRIDEGRDKFVIPVHESFVKDTVILGAICEISIGDVEEVQIKEITGNEKLRILLKNIYRIEFVQISGLYPEYFKKCINIAKNIVLFKVIRPKNQFTAKEQIDIIEKAMHEKYNKVFC